VRFEHLIEINDPLMPLLSTLTRVQLWRGLVRRAEEPTRFVLGLDAATIHQRSERNGVIELTRTLDFGTFTVDDHVVLTPMTRSETRVAPGERFGASRLTIRIEEPVPEQLYLRFVYEFEGDDAVSELDAQTAALRKQAYHDADLDTVKCIRDLAEAGELD
jgi:hypothetical protein